MLSRFFSSFRTRMVAIYMLVTLVALLAMSFIVSSIVENFMVSQRTQSQIKETTRLALEIAPNYCTYRAQQLYDYALSKAQSMNGRVLFIDTDAVIQVDSASIQNGYRLPYREVRDVLLSGKEYSYGFHRIARLPEGIGDGGQHTQYVWAIYYAAPIINNGIYRGAVIFSALLQDVQDSVSMVISQIALVLLAVALIMAGLSYALSGVVTKPIVELTGAIRSMGRQSRGARVKVKGTGEIAELGKAFNRMSEQIESHDRIRDEFVSNASHELKTPLATMKLLSETILYQTDPPPELMLEFFSDVNHEVDRLSNVVTDLLRLVRFDETERHMELRPLRLDEILNRIVARLMPLADKKGIKLSINSTPITVNGDGMRIEQALANLVENAIKYTDSGNVDVSAYVEDDEAQIIVEDTGIGIPENAIPHLFERFYRVDKARSRETGGTGLGLSIVERTLVLHGGDIHVESELGRGSRFIVRLPACGEDEANEK